MEEFWKRYDEFSSQLQSLADTTWDNLLLYKQAESIASLGVGFFALIVSIFLIVLIVKKLAPNWVYGSVYPVQEPLREDPETGRVTLAWREWEYARDRHNRRAGEGNPLPIFGSIFSAIAAMLLLVIVAGPELLYIWNWIGAFVPEARLFHDIFEALGPKVTGTPPAA